MRHILVLVLVAASACYPETRSDEDRRVATFDLSALFSATGFMGDGEYGSRYVRIVGNHSTDPYSPPDCMEVTYAYGPKRWAGVYWLNKADNWGQEPGADLAGYGYSRIVFWAKGKQGTESIEFKAGGISDQNLPHADSFERSARRLGLSTSWQRFEIDLKGANLSSVIGGFAWVASADYNRQAPVVFYIDDVTLE